MRDLLFAVLSVFPSHFVADTEIPHTFNDGTPSQAAEVNETFDAIDAALPPSYCSADQIIKIF